MSWLYSRALVEEYSEGTFSGGEQCAQLSVMPTQHKFWRNDKMMEFSRLSQFGLTCAVLTESRGKDLLTWFREGFLVKTLAQQEKALESKEDGQDYGEKWQELSVKYDLDSSSWKTHHSLLSEDLPWSSVILPKWGMMRSGVLYQHPTAERPIKGIASGLWQTPVADDALDRARGKWNSRGEPKLSAQVKLWPTATDGKGSPALEKVKARAMESKRGVRLPEELARNGDIGQLNPNWVEWLMGWPIGWTGLKPLATDKFQSWRQQHSGFYLENDRSSSKI